MTDKTPDKKKEPTFDMYHLFSRWDLGLAIGFILIVLLIVVYFLFFRDQVV